MGPWELPGMPGVSLHLPLLLPVLISRDTPGLAVQSIELSPGSRK